MYSMRNTKMISYEIEGSIVSLQNKTKAIDFKKQDL